MAFQSVTYASPSAFSSSLERAELAMAGNILRPVQFRGRVVRHAVLLRFALRALGEAVWSEDQWAADADYRSRILDPIITVHPDRLWFEAFSQDLGAYVSLRVDPEVFATEGELRHGTTNIDFTAWLWGALSEMRSSRSTHFQVGAQGLELSTAGAGGRFEQKVDVPDRWLRGFLQVQSAMALPGTRLSLRPVDLLAAIRFLQHNKAKVSPRALRFEMLPGQDAALVVEPWEHRVPLVGATHGYTEPRSIRTWGRRKLKLIESLLPFAERVDVYLKGRAMPSFYAVQLPGMSFLLGLGSGFGESAGLDLLADSESAPAGTQERVHAALAARFHAGTEALSQDTGLPLAETARALAALNRGGRVMFDVEAREWRHRELFSPPIDTTALFPPDPRKEAAAALLAREDGVTLDAVLAEEESRTRRYRNPRTGAPMERTVSYRQWRIRGRSESQATELVVGDEDRIVFGSCGCAFFREHLLNRGPCPHMLALFARSEPQRRAADTPTAAGEPS